MRRRSGASCTRLSFAEGPHTPPPGVRPMAKAQRSALYSVRLKRLAPLLILIIGSAAGAGCVNVRPWERAILADPCMAMVPDPEEAKLEQHLFAYREGSAGGYGDTGGGCGCN